MSGDVFGLRLNADERHALNALAAQAERRPSDYLRRLLRERARQEGLLPEPPNPKLIKLDAQQPQPEKASA